MRKRNSPNDSVDPIRDSAARKREVENALPVGMQIAGAWSWRLLVIAGVLVLLGLIVIEFRFIIVPLMVAVLLSALLVPLVNWLRRHHWPKWLAVVTATLGTIGILTGLIYIIVTQIREGFPDLRDRSLDAWDQFREFLFTSPLGIDDEEFDAYVAQIVHALENNSDAIWSGALSVGSTAGSVLAGLLIVIFTTIFILIDGRGIWAWIVRLFPRRARPAVDGSGHAGWLTLTTFAKVQIFVAFVDAVGIGLGAWILGLFYDGFPLVIPIAIAVFLASFIPFVGAIVTGAIAVFVALIYLDPFASLIMLGIVLLVQQIEGQILQPLVMGSAVRVHPLAVVFAVTAGAGVAGIAGALFAVPIVAVINVMVKYIASGQYRLKRRPDVEDVTSKA